MRLKQLIETLDIKSKLEPKVKDLSILGLADNSADVLKGYLFVAIEGFDADGHNYITHAIENGACAIIGEKNIDSLPIPYIQVTNSRKALGIIANIFYGNLSDHKVMIGITGTNGKTTTSQMIKHILEANGHSCSLIGTIHNVINGQVYQSNNTTPGTLALHKLLSESKDNVFIIEVSSHGLAQHRIEGIKFDFCLFTNLEHEHLDFHKTMDAYFQAKLLLFDHLKGSGQAIVNRDNVWGEKLINILDEREIIVHSIGHSDKNTLQITDLLIEKSIIKFTEIKNNSWISSPIMGVHNMYNSVMSYSLAKLLGIEESNIVNSLKGFQGVKGRFQIISLRNGAKVVVDYAHTAEAISHCLTTAQKSGANKVTQIFGFRGNRDKSKREGMIFVAKELSDRFVLTMDDLNSVPEDEMIESLNKINSHYGNNQGIVIPDRTNAIKWAIENSSYNDWIIITGKGHENYKQKFHLPTKSDEETVLYIENNLFSNLF
ncbi:UDP-N-acetylmuramoyl-L-alanyl-D-glutamate--2,6-diaminopimelate ligase [Ureibacillus chungkukjangi]|uniref:UDP-N-acetylmuramoyl-L-alanyl-D-glutamate--2, 6-diaminopimelate ligase n=1 Tax=Ureibacillus chungkukjangi TaxID=1202712 RepID=UPI00203EA6D2|nr:UDP-N-acetylmuramoyl-L-alanyl-D-glutamate--2,6-diaminopimelate ligase [Ureibacillus chungkukjangi]MCM3390494.1 UDP-N-acetylmuramoyl-L-alanyl-D-glutamate--2,6-diaminopimelate ligase [Ureibacillus chungkukjangi]